MHYKSTLLLACASLTLVVSASPQTDAAAGTGAVVQSTVVQTMVATATIGGTDPAAPTASTGNVAGTGSDGDASDTDSTGDSTGDSAGGDSSGDGVGSDTGPSGTPDSAGSANAAATAAPTGAGTGAGTGSGTGANPGMEPGAGTGSSVSSGFNTGASGLPDGKDGPPAGFWEQLGSMTDGDRAQFWSKFSAGDGHPHQPVARGWSNWFGGGANKAQGNGMGGNDEQHHARALLARDVLVNGGPSWSDVRSGDIGSVKVAARSMPKGGQGWGGAFDGPMGYAGKGQGGQRWGGHGY